ncbi:MAG: helix-turn-helix transcriptional regulator [Clostridiales bacterium]|nr:helix-turn-helix transcriptional regulator [Candidatus Crickella equi]
MSIGERIKFFRRKVGMTQKDLGVAIGYSDVTADIRIAQYESGKRTPKIDTLEKLANVFEISVSALDVPNTDTMNGIMHTLFSLEDSHGLTLTIRDEGCVAVLTDPDKLDDGLILNIYEWARKCDALRKGEITQEEYDDWRYSSNDFYSPSKDSPQLW